MPPFLFSESQILTNVETNEEELTRALHRGDTIMQAELYKHQGLLYLEYIKLDDSDEKRYKAFAFFSEAIALDVDACITAFCLCKRGSLHVKQRNFDAGIADFVMASQLAKNDAQIWFEYAKALIDLERFEEALEPLKEALILTPQDHKIHALVETIMTKEQVVEHKLKDIKALMAAGRALNTGQFRDSGLHLWLQIVRAGDSAFMPYLAPKVDTNLQDGLGNTAVHYAVLFGHAHLIVPLVKNYAVNPDTQNREGLTPIALAVRAGDTDVIQALIDAGAKYALERRQLLTRFENFPLPQMNVPSMGASSGLTRTHSFIAV